MKKIKPFILARHLLQLIYLAASVMGLVYGSWLITAVFMATALLSGAWFCGWLCPLGTLQEFLALAGRRMGLPRLIIPLVVDKYLRFLRYALWAVVTFWGIGFLLTSPYMSLQDVLVGNFTYISASWLIWLGTVLLSALFIDRPFCRYFCSVGAQYGALSMLRIAGIRRNEESCINCSKCSRVCPAGIQVHKVSQVRNAQCINCLECTAACPVEDTLGYRLTLPHIGRKKH